MNITPTGLVPNEDTGTIMVTADLQPGTSQERTEEVMMQIDQILGSHPAMQSRTQIIGFSFLGGQGNTYGSFICKLKPWDERTGKGMDANSVIGALYMQFATQVKDARVLCFAPPMIPGYSVSNGFELTCRINGRLAR